MSQDKRHLWERGDQWYLRVHIPRPLQKHFFTSTGKPKHHIVEPLGDSLSQARLKRNHRVATIEGVFARLRSGEQMTPEQIDTAISLDLNVITEQSKADTLELIPIWFRRLAQHYQISPDDELFQIKIEQISKTLGVPIAPNSELYNMVRTALMHGQQSAQDIAQAKLVAPIIEQTTETISQAAEAWLTQTQSDTSTATKQTTIEGHKQRVGVFVERCGDLPLTSISRSMASDFLANLGQTNRTVNNYGTTLACVFRSAKDRGRFVGGNPFERMRRKVSKKTNRVPFESFELKTLFDALPRVVKPIRHTPESALPWVTLMAAYSGARLEELCQLSTADIRIVNANGATVTCIDVHNGGNNSLKNESAVRLIPIHSQLVKAGLLDYVKVLPKGSMLFPGLIRRLSKANKIGARIGELFRKKLIALGLKRDGLCFHSLRHTVSGQFDTAGVSQTDAARILGHTIPEMSYGIYSTGPGLKRLAAVIEEIKYPGLRL